MTVGLRIDRICGLGLLLPPISRGGCSAQQEWIGIVMRQILLKAAQKWNRLRSHRILTCSLVPILCGGSMLLVWQFQAGASGTSRGWIAPASFAPVSAAQPPMQATLGEPDPLDAVFENDNARGIEIETTKPSNDAKMQDTEALAAATHRMQRMEIELSATRRQLADTQWDLMLSRGQAANAVADRDRYMVQVQELAQQLRENLLELSAAQKSIAELQRQSVAAKIHIEPHSANDRREHVTHPHVTELTAKN